MSAPTIADVDRISALDDPVIRNLQITQCYYELSTQMVQRTGSAANWCTFATWASKQAGQTIRQQDLVRALERALRSPTALNTVSPAATPLANQDAAAGEMQRLDKALWDVLDPKAPFDRASAAVAQGNRKVFIEIGRIFADFAAVCLTDASYDSAKIDAFCGDLRTGPPPDGQDYLRRAFTSYYAALFATDAKERAERLLLANVAIGLHEQTRLQPEIVAALDSPIVDPRDLTARLAAALYPYPRWLVRPWLFLRRLVGRPVVAEKVVDLFAGHVRQLAHQIVTEHLMTITLPGGAYLRLGHDLRAAYPASLQTITDADLTALLAAVDLTPDSVAETGAVDWGDLAERLHFIADMFRCYQETPLLLEPPFTANQVATLKAGRLPTGEL